MKFIFPALALACSASALAADAPAKRNVPILTRTVQMFGTLENQWLDAVQARDQDTLKTLVADNYELRIAAEPGRPTPREESLKRMLADPAYESHIEQMAAHEYGNIVVVSFMWKLAVPKGSALAEQVFVVDTWKQNEAGWQVATRYAAPVGPSKSVPGADLASPVIKKKM